MTNAAPAQESSLLRRGIAAVVGRSLPLPPELAERHPELREARYRVGGLPPRIGGWCLGTRTVAAITLWRTVWLAPQARMAPALLLHELGHVRQFLADRTFPARYCLESLRRGYSRNRYELEAEAFAQLRLAVNRSAPPPRHSAGRDSQPEGF